MSRITQDTRNTTDPASDKEFSPAPDKKICDAVSRAQSAHPGWAAFTATQRSHVLYRVGDVFDTYRPQMIDTIIRSHGVKTSRAEQHLSDAIDVWMWYAGWADKYAQFASSVNPVAGPYLTVSAPQPVGIVGAVVSEKSSLVEIISAIASVIVSGNTVIVGAARKNSFALSVAEILATSDIPSGVVNVVTESPVSFAAAMAAHPNVDALDLANLTENEWADCCDIATLETMKCLRLPGTITPVRALSRITAFTLNKTLWHNKSLL